MREMFIEQPSRYDFDKTVELIENRIAEAGWRQMAIHNLQQSLSNNGYEVRPIKVIELCNPHHAQKILRLDEERIFSNLMPCRISVYEKTDGTVHVSLMNAGAVAAGVGGVVAEVMSTVYEESLSFVDVVKK